MNDVILTREEFYPNGIVGTLRFEPDAGVDGWHALEPPWLDNKRDASCIPEGEYLLSPRIPTDRFSYPHAIVLDVPDRTAILIHAGNYPEDTTGCVLLGEKRAGDKPEVYASRAALRRFLQAWGARIAATGAVHLNLRVRARAA